MIHQFYAYDGAIHCKRVIFIQTHSHEWHVNARLYLKRRLTLFAEQNTAYEKMEFEYCVKAVVVAAATHEYTMRSLSINAKYERGKRMPKRIIESTWLIGKKESYINMFKMSRITCTHRDQQDCCKLHISICCS